MTAGTARFAPGTFFLLPDELLKVAITNRLQRADMLVLGYLLQRVSAAGEMQPVSLASVSVRSGCLNANQASKSQSRLRRAGIIEPMMRIYGGSMVEDRSNVGHIQSFAIPEEVWNQVPQESPVARGGETHLSKNGVVRTSCPHPVYPSGTYTAIPHGFLEEACRRRLSGRGTFALIMHGRHASEDGVFGKLHPEWVEAKFGFKRRDLREGTIELVTKGLIRGFDGKEGRKYRASAELWRWVSLDDEQAASRYQDTTYRKATI